MEHSFHEIMYQENRLRCCTDIQLTKTQIVKIVGSILPKLLLAKS